MRLSELYGRLFINTSDTHRRQHQWTNSGSLFAPKLPLELPMLFSS